MHDVAAYLRRVARHWLVLVLGAGSGFVTWFGWVGWLPRWLGPVVLVGAVSVAQFLVWREVRSESAEVRAREAALASRLAELTAPGVQILGGLEKKTAKAFQPGNPKREGQHGLFVRAVTTASLSELRVAAGSPIQYKDLRVNGPSEVNRPADWEQPDPRQLSAFFRPPVGPGCQLDLTLGSGQAIERVMLEARAPEGS